jgi:hypothetical protein
MSDAHANFAFSVVTVAPSPAASGTTLTVLATTGWPAVPFNATVWPAGSNPTAANAEIVRVTANTSGAFTIARTQEGTSARTIVPGDILSANPTALTFTDAEGYTLYAGHSAWSPVDGTTYYWGAYPAGAPSTTANIETILVPKAGTVTRVDLTILIAGTNGSGETSSFVLRKNGSDALTLNGTKVFNGGTNTRISVSYTGLSLAVVAGDWLEFRENAATYVTNPTNILQTGHILIT